MATSPIYSWPEPDNTDLVKNGALAIRTLGNAIDTTMGTMVAKTVVDAKGDLIAGTAADTVNRLAVGANGETLVADSSTSTGLRYQGTMAAGKNAIINGGLDIWQRGTTGTFSGSFVYLADRWANVCTGTAPTCTVSRQTADTAGLQYGVRFGRNSGQTNTGSPNLITVFETAQSIPYAGKTIVLSFSVKAGANAPNNFTPFITYGTGTDQALGSFFGGWTGQTTLYNSTVSTTTTMTRYSVSVAVPSSATQIGVSFYYAPTGTAGANEWFQVEGVQFEVGSVPTNFTRAGGTIQGELAACQRYYVAWNSPSEVSDARIGQGFGSSTTSAGFAIPLPVQMRVAPTTIDWTNTAVNYITAEQTITALAFTAAVNNKQTAALTATVAGGLTANAPYFLSTRVSNRFGLGAEL